eukprot:TRINITY_DN3269_c0_g1_i1.p1 TRINITY_DN3269_c0_g1~~TRINITY_DN3269_c0_g1_i1.p1  ORF type:complete len:271 (+),score=31.30 TRINITY_DN3269_c0_g1_i1:203-1015(+)
MSNQACVPSFELFSRSHSLAPVRKVLNFDYKRNRCAEFVFPFPGQSRPAQRGGCVRAEQSLGLVRSTRNLSRIQGMEIGKSHGEEESRRRSFIARLAMAWHILFPPRKKPPSVAEIGRERLKLVLYSDRGDISPEIKQKLRTNIVEAISSYVDIESEEDVQLNVTADPDFGTVYSVSVPVRRVKPEYQQYWSEGGFRDSAYEDVLLRKSDAEAMDAELPPSSIYHDRQTFSSSLWKYPSIPTKTLGGAEQGWRVKGESHGVVTGAVPVKL